MSSVIVSSLIAIVLVSAYRLAWWRRYGRRRAGRAITRLQGCVADDGGAPVLQRGLDGELERRSFELELADGRRCRVDPRSPWLVLACRGAIRPGALVTVDGVATTVTRPEASYREASVAPALEALRVAPGAWPELGLLWLPRAAAAALLATALAAPRLFAAPAPEARAWVPPPPPVITLPCPRGAVSRSAYPEAWCARPDGTRHGPARSYWEPDQPREAGAYADGKREGPWTFFQSCGRPMQRGRYAAGQLDGCWERWEGLMLRSRECYTAGKLDGEWLLWNENGRLIERGHHRRGRKHGRWEVWSPDGLLLRAGDHEDGERHGHWRFWNEDGGLAARGGYHEGERDGAWSWWHDTRRPAGRGSYQRGVKHGRWVSFYPSGLKAADGRYRDGEPVGRWRVWREQEWSSIAAR